MVCIKKVYYLIVDNISLFVDPDDSASQIPTSRVSRNSECSSVIIKAAKKLKRLNLQQKEMELKQVEMEKERTSTERNGTKTRRQVEMEQEKERITIEAHK